MTGELRDAATQRLLVPRVVAAEGLLTRTIGLIGHNKLGNDEALWFDRCSAIHTFLMRFSIDVLFLDAAAAVKRVVAGVPPWRPAVGLRGARSVLEMAAGSAARLGIVEGSRLIFQWDRPTSSS